jgi:cob(I)alamin adenosyltransferase
MGNRLSRIVTRTGDAGTTGLATGGRVPKSHPRIRAMGDIDELNCQVGVLLTQRLPASLKTTLLRVQHELFNLGGELSMPGAAVVKAEEVTALETDVERLNATLPPLKEFVLPGGNAAAAQAHLARAVARRAERSLWLVNDAEPFNPHALRYANRLSDFLFVAARTLARARGGSEVTWNHTRKR